MAESALTNCRLCRREEPLVRSHILPEFLHRKLELYGKEYARKKKGVKKRELWQFGTNPTTAGPRRYQIGIRERLLCAVCDNWLGKFEDYANKIIFDPKAEDSCQAIPFGKKQSLQVDYCRFKLFQISLIWRMGISSNKAFHAIQLGSHEEILRNMLNFSNAGRSADYGCVILRNPLGTNVTNQVICPIGTKIVDGIPVVTLMLGNSLWVYALAGSEDSPFEAKMHLSDCGQLRIFEPASLHLNYLSWILQFADAQFQRSLRQGT